MKLYEDKICDFLDSCARAGIKDPVRYLESKRVMVFDWLVGCFPRKILPTDVDGEVEINGHFLRLEFKDQSALREGRMSKGQSFLFSKLAKTGLFTVFVIGVDESGMPTCAHVYGSDGKLSKLIEVNRDIIRHWCSVWSQRSENGSETLANRKATP